LAQQQAQSGYHAVGSAREQAQHLAGFFRCLRLAQHGSIQHHKGIRGDDERIVIARRHRFRFGACQPLGKRSGA
jgi:hypothetical protein